MNKKLHILFFFVFQSINAMETNLLSTMQDYCVKYEAFNFIQTARSADSSFSPTIEQHTAFCGDLKCLIYPESNETLNRTEALKKIKNLYKEHCSIYPDDEFLNNYYDRMSTRLNSQNEAIKKKIDNLTDHTKLKNLLKNCIITRKIVVRKSAKSAENVESCFMIPLCDLLVLSEDSYEFVTQLIQSNRIGGTLVKWNQEMKTKWQQLDANIKKNLEDLKIDIESKSETIVDKIIRHIPLIAVVSMPNLLLRHSSKIPLLNGTILKTVEFFGSIGISYFIGNHIFPRLDDSCNSHVSLLKSFFAKNVRTRIRRGSSFFFFSFVVTTLSYLAHFNSQGIYHFSNIFLYIALILSYNKMNNHLSWNNPIDRGAPELDTRMSKEKRESLRYTYQLKHLSNT